MAADFAGTLYTTNTVYLNGIHIASLTGNTFNNCVSNYVLNASRKEPVRMGGNHFDIGGISRAAESQVLARISGAVVWDGEYKGSGAPSISADNGSRYRRIDGTGPNLYIRENKVWLGK